MSHQEDAVDAGAEPVGGEAAGATKGESVKSANPRPKSKATSRPPKKVRIEEQSGGDGAAVGGGWHSLGLEP